MNETLKVLNYEGDVSVGSAGDISLKLRTLLGDGHSLILNLSQTEKIDLSTIQIFVAAKKTGRRAGLSVQIANQVSPVVQQTFYYCGITKTPESSGREIDAALSDLLEGAL